ncbi:hypothetical protein VZT92_013196 [Zoarces viviparus]|uniref:Collagen alpha-1(VII) chain n=1 Tax=Zoarces viviparus TaxID=48416 RepID=A0AAW1F236_ZOAVI
MWSWFFAATVLLSSMKWIEAQGRCNNVQAADIVFLVDGSSSIGRANFLQVKGFIAGIIKPYASSVSESGIRFGVIQYSDTSRVEFTFSTYLVGTELVNAVENLNYKGGNTRTGAGLKFVADNFFNPASSRDVAKITILITDGKSQDSVEEPAQKLRSQGVHVYAVGIKSADMNELAKIASQPVGDFTSFVGDFKLLNTLLPLVSPQVCSKAGGVYAGDEAFSGPSNIQFTGQTSDTLRFRWSAAGGPLSGYVVQYVPLSGLGQPITAELRQETVSASQRAFTAKELRSGTDYLVTIIAQYPNSVGESVSAKQRTRSLPGVTSLRLVQAGFFSLSVGWDQPSSPVQGYRLTYGPRGQPAAQLLEQSLSADSTSVTLESLQPDTEYVVSLYPLFPRNSAPPSILNARTLRLEAVQQLSVETESEGSVRVRWRGVIGTRAYRLVWGPFTGRNVETVEVAGDFHTLSGLQSDTEYIVTIIPLYEGDTEGPVATARFKIERQEQQVLRAATTGPSSIRLTWRIIRSSQGYRLDYMAGEGGRVQSLTFPRTTTSYELTGLQPNTEYIITLYTLFEGREEATPVSTISKEDQPVGRVSNLRVVESLGSTVRLGWTGVAGATQYRIIILNTEAGSEEIRRIPGNQTTLDLRDLTVGVSYGVSVTALVGENEGDPVTVYIKPEQGAGRVTNLRVSNANTRRIRIAWTGAPGATGYRVTWRQGNNAEQSRILEAEATAFTIDGLQPDEALVIGVASVVDQRVGEVVTLSSRTNPNGGSVAGLRIVDVTSQRIRIAWSRSTRSTGYKITWRTGDGVESTRNVAADISSYTIDGLQSDSAYNVFVSSLTGSREGSPSTLSIRTESDRSVVGTVTSLQIQEGRGEVVRVTWVGVQGATAYRVSWRKTDGGDERSQLLGGDVTAVDLDQLDPGAQYEVQVMALVQNREGTPVSVRVTTPGSPSPPVTITVRVAEVTQNSMRIGWTPLPGATGYILRWREATEVGRGLSVTLPAASSSYQVTGLRLGRRYRFTVQPTVENGLGTESSVVARTVCVGGRLDVVFLVPASTDRISLARPLRELLTSAAGSLDTIGANDSQFGVVVYGYRPKLWFLLNRHGRYDTLLQEIQSTPFDESPGNNIGEAVTYTRQYLLTPSAGRRPRVPGAVVIIADKVSVDNLTLAANGLKATGVTVLAVGIDQANTEELRRAVTDGSTQNILYARDAAQLDTLHTDLADLLCGIARIPDVGPGPAQCTVQCPQGERGYRGETGERGRDGVDGRKGDSGRDGVPGREGPRGAEGRPGPPGQTIPIDPSLGGKGEKGERGFPGIDGSSGLPGRPGPSGSAGVPGSQGLPGIRGDPGGPGGTGPLGPKGTKGERGESGSAISGGGLPGRKGEPGIPGIPGTPGRSGSDGSKGALGAPGIPGQDGRPGLSGAPGLSIKGDKGSSGDRGPPGVGSGVAVKGEKGFPGSPGPPGPHSPRGPSGPQGSKGDKGDGGDGVPGLTGRQGDPGDRGPRGPPGEIGGKGDRGQPGEAGSQGDRGERGLAGETGQRGDPGKPGLAGAPGLRGLPGPSGAAGEKGNEGARGEPGRSAPGIPGKKGDQGDRGLPGTDGARGEKGEAAQRGEKGSPGSGGSAVGPKGEPGERGVAGIGGRPGAKGDPGEPAERGENGRPGIPGKPGPAGKEGERGEKGDEGTPGESGLPGKAGERGLRGLAGQPGRPGEKGDFGDPGEHGRNGSPGSAGPRGEKGGLGPQGPPGPVGKVADIQGQLKGERGDKGDAGDPGEHGGKGQKGEAATPGAPGPRGPEGLRGPAGTRGDTGERGAPGEKGDRGTSGLDGRSGLDGKPGAAGPPGQRGDPGKQGDPGRDGLPGLRGGQGPSGPVGPPGTAGTPGKAGEDGKAGSPGKMGEDGVPGEDGRKVCGCYQFKQSPDTDRMRAETDRKETGVSLGLPDPLALPGLLEYLAALVHLDRWCMSKELQRHQSPARRGLQEPLAFLGSLELWEPEAIEARLARKGDPGEDGAPGKPGTAVDVQKALASHGIQMSDLKVVVDKKDILVAPSVQKAVKGDKGDSGEPGPRGSSGADEREEQKGIKGIEDPWEQLGRQVELLESEGQRDPQGLLESQANQEYREFLDELGNWGRLEEREIRGPPGVVGQKGEPGAAGSPGLQGERGLVVTKETEASLEKQDVMARRDHRENQENWGLPGFPGVLGRPVGSLLLAGMLELWRREGWENLSLWVNRVNQESLDEMGCLAKKEYLDYQESRCANAGPPGQAGLKGEQGDSGPPGKVVAGAPGPKGERGLSGQTLPGTTGERGLPGEKGNRGDKGAAASKGERGVDGEPGEPGEDGSQGPSGPKGDKGEKGIGQLGPPGRVGPQGLKGDPGLPGSAGPPGLQGKSGDAGQPGLRGETGQLGPAGPQGERGLQGFAGRAGNVGPPGPAGPPGQAGSPGTNGFKGDKGEVGVGIPGPRGERGESGLRGEEGRAGLDGERGPTGSPGNRGAWGEKGDIGLQGDKGEKGDTVLVGGPAGENGNKGETGDRGPKGVLGEKGVKGQEGPLGEQGLRGEPGERGSIGFPGARGPGGQKGEAGQPGVPGESGFRGKDGMPGQTGEKGELGVVGMRGIKGDRGPKGACGNDGSKGDKGDGGIHGRSGLPGRKGEQGELGPSGAPGTPGKEGLVGPKGDRGFDGLAGPKGTQGEKGERGPSGVPGPPGPRGVDGVSGLSGTQGPAGAKGPEGLQGQKGERGPIGPAVVGPRGIPGISGERGEAGELGPDGTKGDRGEPGMTEYEVREYVRTEMSQHCGSGPVNRSQPPVRSRPAPEQQLVVKGEEGRELHVVVNTNDPDYEHIYSVETYDNPLEELLYFTPTANQNDGEVVKDETDKTVKVEPNKSATADVKKTARAGGQKEAKVTSLKAVKSRSVRIKRRVKGEAPADLCLLPMEEGSCGRYTLRWYFNSQVQACRPFIYSGCEGNDNRFLHLEECEELCLGEAEGPRPLKTAR